MKVFCQLLAAGEGRVMRTIDKDEGFSVVGATVTSSSGKPECLADSVEQDGHRSHRSYDARYNQGYYQLGVRENSYHGERGIGMGGGSS